MVQKKEEKGEVLYQCEECGFHYRTKELAEQCENWCRTHHSCNLEIIQYAMENQKNSRGSIREVLLVFGALAGIVLFVAVGWFYRQNLRGIWPALQGPKEDISALINTTGMPLNLPPGFAISIFAKDLGSPRVLNYDPLGNIIASIPREGKVVALPDKNGDGVADEAITIAEGLNRPHGLATRCTERCELYIAETDGVAVYEYDEKKLKAINRRKIIDLPSGGGHYTRTILFMPAPNDHKLLISVGSSCNVCNEEDWRRAKILVANADGSELKEFARGLRNAVFLAIHPVTGKIWATEMGRDLLGDDIPPDEINIVEEGKNYGWPICYGNNIHDADFDKNVYVRNPCMEPFETPSHIDIQAHSAPLGLAFVPEEGWPEEYWHDLFVAYHGSWNRSVPTGYRVVRYKLDAQGNYEGKEDFIWGWLQRDYSTLGRPVDILIQPGGVMYISDDGAGVIYKVVYKGQEAGALLETEKRRTDLLRNVNINSEDFVKSPLVVAGEARGFWFFEASFPIRLYDVDGKELAVGIAQAQEEWMTEDFVPFRAELLFTKPNTSEGVLVLEKDNPSGLPEHADEFRIPVRF